MSGDPHPRDIPQTRQPPRTSNEASGITAPSGPLNPTRHATTRHLIRSYPRQRVVLLAALLLAGIAEGASLSALLPLLSFAIDQETRDTDTGLDNPSGDSHEFQQLVTQLLSSMGISPTIGVLLGVVVSGIALKSTLLLIARKRIGYTASRIVTDLRLDLLRALLSSRWEYFIHQPIGRLANAMSMEADRASKSYLFATTLIALLIQACVYTAVALLVS